MTVINLVLYLSPSLPHRIEPTALEKATKLIAVTETLFENPLSPKYETTCNIVPAVAIPVKKRELNTNTKDNDLRAFFRSSRSNFKLFSCPVSKDSCRWITGPGLTNLTQR